MRDLTNAIVRFSWTMPLFGMKQMLNLMTCTSCSGRRTTGMVEALNEVSGAARRHLGGSIEQVANAWAEAQTAVNDAVFRRAPARTSGTSPSPETKNPRSDDEQGWGPVPPVGR